MNSYALIKHKDVAGLVLKRDESYRKWKDVEGVLHLMDSSELKYDIRTGMG